MITIEEVCYFQADTKCTVVALAGGEALIHMTIDDQGSAGAARSGATRCAWGNRSRIDFGRRSERGYEPF